MVDLIPVKSPEYDLPSPSSPGRILFEILVPGWPGVYRYESEVLDHDGDSAVFWLFEGVGWNYWIDQHIDLELDGFYVVEDVTVTFTRGDGWMTDDDEDWDFGIVRRATQQEIETGQLEARNG